MITQSSTVRKPFGPRLGLQESLEEFTARHPLQYPLACRWAWRLEGMRLLGLDTSKAVLDGRYQPRICAEACPTKNGLTVFEEDEDTIYPLGNIHEEYL